MNMAAQFPEASSRRLFLGVEHSACGRAWRDRLDERGAAQALAIAQRHDNVPELLARVLAGRGVAVEDVPGFLDPTVRALMPDPHSLAGMEDAAARIADAVMRGETVAIFGDYDVDGATSAATLARFLRHAGLDSADPYPGSAVRGLRPQRRGGAGAGRPWCNAADHGRLRHHQPRTARRGETARHGRDRDRPSPCRRGAAACARGGESRTGSTIFPASAISPRSVSCS